MPERFSLSENLQANKEFHELAGECLGSTDIVLREMGTDLSNLALSISPGDDSAPYYKLHELAGKIRSYMREHGVLAENKDVSLPAETRPDGEPDLSQFHYFEYRTRGKKPDLPADIQTLLDHSEEVYFFEDFHRALHAIKVFETPGGQLLAMEQYRHQDGNRSVNSFEEEVDPFAGDHDYGFAVYSIPREEFEQNNRTAEFKKFELDGTLARA